MTLFSWTAHVSMGEKYCDETVPHNQRWPHASSSTGRPGTGAGLGSFLPPAQTCQRPSRQLLPKHFRPCVFHRRLHPGQLLHCHAGRGHRLQRKIDMIRERREELTTPIAYSASNPTLLTN